MYRAYGHIEIMPVDMGFVTPVFIRNGDFFLEVVLDGRISEFIPLPELYRKFLFEDSSNSEVWSSPRQQCVYAFKSNARVIIAKGKELALELQKLPLHQKTDLDIESFLDTHLSPLMKKVASVSNNPEEYLEDDVTNGGPQVKELISLMAKRKVDIRIVDGKLVVRAAKGELNRELVAEIRHHKNMLLEFLKSNQEAARIPIASPQEGYDLSSAERRLWVQSQYEDAGVQNILDAYVFEGELSYSALEYAFNVLIERHEILRTVFQSDGQGLIKQYIKTAEEIGFFIQHKDLSNSTDQDHELKVLIQDASKTSFYLSSGPLLKATLCQLREHKWVFVFVMHHIISDGWSVNILIKELLQLYNAHLKGEVNPLPSLRIQYKDFSVWQQQQLKENAFEQHKKYWLEQFSGELPVLTLSSNKPRPIIKTYNGREISLLLSKELVQSLGNLCRQQGATLYMGLLATVNVLLYRYTNQRDIIIGCPIAGRMDSELEVQIGCYVNTLALRTRFSEESSFMQLLSVVKQVNLEAYEHQAYPLDELVEALNLQGNRGRSALFDVVVTLQNYQSSDVLGDFQVLNGLRVSKYPLEDSGVSKFDLTFVFMEDNGGIRLVLFYNTDIYEHWVIEQMGRHLEQLISAAVSNPSTPIWQLDYLSKQEKHLLLNEFNDAANSYQRGNTLVELFEAQVERTPDKPAILFDGVVLSYKQLNRQANRLAHFLRVRYHIAPDDLISVKLEHSHWLIITLLGVLKSGAAYMPISTDYPADRVDYMVLDSGCKLVIDNEELHRARKEAYKYSDHNPTKVSGPSNLAYVIYTSGITGKPKGVSVEHRNVAQLFMGARQAFNFGEQDTWTFFHSFCFDFSVWEMYGALLFGGMLIVVPRKITQNTKAFRQLLVSHKVTVLNQTPSAFYNLLNEELDSKSSDLKVRYLIFGGEELNPGWLKGWSEKYKSVKIINIYGPTEATIYVTFKEITVTEIEENSSSIGWPNPTSSCYVLDQNQQLLPAGVWGELYVGGAGVCRGYLNRPDLEARHFLANPFKTGERLYRTGDKARILRNGEFEYGGRIDEQVKVRGYRIELGEIESILGAHPDIEAALVIARTGNRGEKELVLYAVSQKTLNAAELKAYLSKTLPAYMLPSRFVQLARIPLTENGKVDRRALPDPEGLEMPASVAYMAPRNETEEKMALIWQEVLGIEKIGIRDNFFELGGHSLKMAHLVSLASKAFKVKLDILGLLSHPTVEEFVNVVLKADSLADEGSSDETARAVRKKLN